MKTIRELKASQRSSAVSLRLLFFVTERNLLGQTAAGISEFVHHFWNLPLSLQIPLDFGSNLIVLLLVCTI